MIDKMKKILFTYTRHFIHDNMSQLYLKEIK